MIFATGLHSCKKKFWILIQHFYFYSFLTYSEHIRKCSKLQIMIVFPVLIPVQNFLFPGTGRENLKCHGKGRDGKFEACIPGNHGKREFPLTPALWGGVEWAGAELNGINTWECHIWHPWTPSFLKNIAYVGSFKHFSVQLFFTCILQFNQDQR